MILQWKGVSDVAKVKMCLDALCTRYYELDNGTVVATPKEKCDVGTARKNPKSLADFKSRFNRMVANTNRTVYISEDPNWTEGSDATF